MRWASQLTEVCSSAHSAVVPPYPAQSLSPDFTQQVLANHELAMEGRLAETEGIVAELQSGVAPVTHTPVHVREEPALDAVRVRGKVKAADLGDWAVSVFERLFAVVRRAEV